MLGTKFSLGLVKRTIQRSDDRLERALAHLQLGEFIYEQLVPEDIEYHFKHALTHEVVYNSVLIKHRKLLHERAGSAIESLHAGRLDDFLDELARHYSHSDNASKAVEYLRRI